MYRVAPKAGSASRRRFRHSRKSMNERNVVRLTFAALAAIVLTTGCAVAPTGPSMPAHREAWDQFQVDDAQCRQVALNRSGPPSEAAATAGVGSAIVGTAIGAAGGGLIGGNNGAAVGAGMGLFTGSVVGANNAYAAGATTQQIYDSAYFQCMYALGNRVPAPPGYAASMRSASVAPRVAAPPPNAVTPPRNAPPPNAAIPPPNAPPPNAPPPNAAIPPPDTPPPYQLPR